MRWVEGTHQVRLEFWDQTIDPQQPCYKALNALLFAPFLPLG